MDRSVFAACAVTHVYGKLEHGEAILLQVLAEEGVCLLVLLCFRWKVEQYEYPHDAVFAKSVHIVGQLKFRVGDAAQFAGKAFVKGCGGLAYSDHQRAAFTVYGDVQRRDRQKFPLCFLA